MLLFFLTAFSNFFCRGLLQRAFCRGLFAEGFHCKIFFRRTEAAVWWCFINNVFKISCQIHQKTRAVFQFFQNKIRKKILRENCLNPEEVKLSGRLRFGFSHLRDRKFKYSFLVSQLYIQLWYRTVHYLLHCPNYLHEKNPVWTTSNLSFLIFWIK